MNGRLASSGGTRRPSAILLIGPTGSGKTPLGEHLEANGLFGRRCAHLDFGARLREIGAGKSRPVRLSEDDIRTVVRSLAENALLEKRNFHIAEAILRDFAERRALQPGDLIVLNGLPRHVSQARDVDRIVDVKLVVSLECAPGVVAERIRMNSGGDRSGRTDDSAKEVSRKLHVFRERTAPILDHYRRKRVSIESVDVASRTSAEDIRRQLSERRLAI